MPSAEQVGAISIPNGALLLTLRVYQIRSRGEKKCGWSSDSLGFSPKHVDRPRGSVQGRRTARQGEASECILVMGEWTVILGLPPLASSSRCALRLNSLCHPS